MTRDPSSVGAGLEPVRPARPIDPGERIHVVGAAGAGASAAALLAAAAGAIMSGCDAGGPSPYTPAIEARGIVLDWTHDAAHVTTTPPPDRLAVTKALTAISPQHPELVAARSRGIPVEAWQQVVADAASGRRLVGVAGTHGKSTTAGWLLHILVGAGLDPSACVGALLPPAITGGLPATARSGTGPLFVVEADEYAGNFDAYRPDIAIVTSADWDHPDVFADREAVIDAFRRWLEAMPAGGTIVANVGDAGVEAVLDGLTSQRPLTTAPYLLVTDDDTGRAGSGRGAVAGSSVQPVIGRIVAAEPSGTVLEIRGIDAAGGVTRVGSPLAGRRNAENALAVAAAATVLGVPIESIVAGLESFPGVGRRLERKGEARGVVVYDDYGHHPTAITATIEAVRQREPGRRVWAVYEPLTYHRTAALLPAFAEALATADAVAVADIWAGRDPDTTIASAAGLAREVTARRPTIAAAAPGSVDTTAEWLAENVRSGDAVLVMGGGQSYKIGERLLDLLEAR